MRQRVIVVMPTADLPVRRKLDGILKYGRTRKGGNRPWAVNIENSGNVSQSIGDPARWEADGIIAYVRNDRERERHLAAKIPTVLIDCRGVGVTGRRSPRRNVVVIANDHAAEGVTAAQYFLKRGYRSFAYFDSAEDTPWNSERRRGFGAEIAAHGGKVIPYPAATPEERLDFSAELPKAVAWLKSLPPRTAVFTAHDFRARQLLVAGDVAGRSTPGDFALLSVDDDEVLCTTASPAVSSISVGDASTGMAAGRALDELMAGTARGRVIVTRHTRVVTRASTDATAFEDSFISDALRWMAANIARHPTAEDVAEAVGCSKRFLQMRFDRVLGTTLGKELRSMRLSRALELITDTNDGMEAIVTACGYASRSHLGAAVLVATGKTPLEIRAELLKSALRE